MQLPMVVFYRRIAGEILAGARMQISIQKLDFCIKYMMTNGSNDNTRQRLIINLQSLLVFHHCVIVFECYHAWRQIQELTIGGSMSMEDEETEPKPWL
jgi:hypothetical protein